MMVLQPLLLDLGDAFLLPLIAAVIGGIITAIIISMLGDPVKNWWASSSLQRTRKRLVSVEASLKEMEEYHVNPASLIPWGISRILAFISAGTFLIILWILLVINQQTEMASAHIKNGVFSTQDRWMMGGNSLLMAIYVLRFMLDTEKVRNIRYFSEYKAKREKLLAALQRRVSSMSPVLPAP